MSVSSAHEKQRVQAHYRALALRLEAIESLEDCAPIESPRVDVHGILIERRRAPRDGRWSLASVVGLLCSRLVRWW